MQSCESSCNGNQDSGGGGSGDGDGNGDGDCRQIILSKTRPPSPTKVSISKPQSDEQVVNVDVDFDDDDDVDEFQIDISYLPDFLLVEILMRLPVKSVFRFKCVSKHWSSLISDPFFARMYVSRKLNYSSLSPFRILYRYIYVSAFPQILDRLRPDSPHVSVSENFSVLFLSSYQEQQHADQFKILAVSKGLILCCLLGPLIYYVCDPVTGKWVSLPRHQSRVHSRHPIFMGEGLVALTNEDNVVTSYKVVRVEYRSAESAYLNFESYSSETGEWKNYRLSFSQPVQLIKRGSPFLFNGAMHWFTYGKGMVAFDPCKNVKECRLIRFPNHRDIESENNYDGLYRLCEECKGKLRYFETATDTAEPFCFRMWVMQDYEKAEWKLEHRATRSEIWSDDPYISSYLLHVSFVPLAYHPFNLDIVYLRCAERACIVTYNFITKRLEVSCNPVGIVDDLSWRVVMPFVLPMWPAPLPKRARRGTKRFRPGNAICAH